MATGKATETFILSVWEFGGSGEQMSPVRKPQRVKRRTEEGRREAVPAVDLCVGVRRGQAVGHVALHALELGLLGGVIDGARERVGVLLPLRSVLAHHHADLVSVLHKSRGLPEQEGLPSGLDEGGEPVEVPPHSRRALGLLLMTLGALAPPWQGGGHWVHGGRGAQTPRRISRRRAIVPVVVPVVVAALAGVEAASTTAAGRVGGVGGRLGFGFGRGEAVVVGVGGDVVLDDLHIGGREEASLPPAVLPLQPALQLLLAEQSDQLILCYGDLSWVFRAEVVQHSGL